jgi:predicted RNase H-like HicB family nuclease
VREYKFTVIIEPCEEGGYFARCPALQGCYTQGESYEETIANIQDAIKLYLEDLIESGESIPEDVCEAITSVKVAV